MIGNIQLLPFRQGAAIYDTAEATGGSRHFASDFTEGFSLNLFLAETAERGCSEAEADTVVQFKYY